MRIQISSDVLDYLPTYGKEFTLYLKLHGCRVVEGSYADHDFIVNGPVYDWLDRSVPLPPANKLISKKLWREIIKYAYRYGYPCGCMACQYKMVRS